jgi:predicted dehydrogenase
MGLRRYEPVLGEKMPHRVLIIGVGSIGERHLRCFRATERAELSFVEINSELRRTVAERYGLRSCHADLETALTERHDMAVIATPAQLHVPLALRLAEAGVHLLIEKPLGTSLDGVDRLRRLAQQRGLVVAVAYVYRVHPCLTTMKEALAKGRFGKPVQLVAVSGQHFPTFRPAYRSIYYTDRAQGGGAIQDALTHLANAGEWLVGPVDRLVVDAAHQVLEGIEVEDTVHMLTRQGPVLGCYSLNQHQAANEYTLTVICEHGIVRCEFHLNRWRWQPRPGDDWHDEAVGPLERDTVFTIQANRFLDAVERKGAVPCSLDEGVQTLKVNLAALESLQDQRWHMIQPAARYNSFSARSEPAEGNP